MSRGARHASTRVRPDQLRKPLSGSRDSSLPTLACMCAMLQVSPADHFLLWYFQRTLIASLSNPIAPQRPKKRLLTFKISMRGCKRPALVIPRRVSAFASPRLLELLGEEHDSSGKPRGDPFLPLQTRAISLFPRKTPLPSDVTRPRRPTAEVQGGRRDATWPSSPCRCKCPRRRMLCAPSFTKTGALIRFLFPPPSEWGPLRMCRRESRILNPRDGAKQRHLLLDVTSY